MFFNQPPTAKLDDFSTPTSEHKGKEQIWAEDEPTVQQAKNGLGMDNKVFN